MDGAVTSGTVCNGSVATGAEEAVLLGADKAGISKTGVVGSAPAVKSICQETAFAQGLQHAEERRYLSDIRSDHYHNSGTR